MKTNYKSAGVNPRKAPSISEGLHVLSQYPEIRNQVRYRSDRWECTYWEESLHEARWHVSSSPAATRKRLSYWPFERLTSREIGSVMVALYGEGIELASDDENPVLLTYPEFADEVRGHWMPMVRQFFKHRGRAFYELVAGKWQVIVENPSAALGRVRIRIDHRMYMEFRKSVPPISRAACEQELILEGRDERD